ncbi:hypothetical protein Tco_1564706 [Tanacetum coccineum]
MVRPKSNWEKSDCWLIVGDIVEIQKVIQTVKIDEVRQIVDVESSGKSVDEIDKEIVSLVRCNQRKRIGATTKSVQKLGIDLKLLQWHLVNIHIIE